MEERLPQRDEDPFAWEPKPLVKHRKKKPMKRDSKYLSPKDLREVLGFERWINSVSPFYRYHSHP